jgi:hypothetical protein
MLTKAEVITALAEVVKTGAIPLREPSTARPTYWSYPLLYTKCRPVPVGLTWLDFIVVQSGVGLAPARHMANINRWVATGLLDMAGTGLEYRMLVDEALLPPMLFSLPPGVERNVDRFSPSPWPVQPQKINVCLQNHQRFRLQVRHSSGVPVMALASLTGWFSPNLSNNNREAFEASGYDQDETVGSNT